jgi:hypothetical protein
MDEKTRWMKRQGVLATQSVVVEPLRALDPEKVKGTFEEV